MFGHICTDINQGALPAILPFLVANNNISYASAAGLVFAASSVSSLVQPLCGYFGDKVSWPWLMGLGVLLAGGGLAMIGFLDNYWAIFFAVMLSGIGIALFHPEGGKIANVVAGEKKGTGMSIFAVGGNIGFSIGPILASVALTAWGLRGTVIFLVPAVIMALVIFARIKTLREFSAHNAKKNQTAGQAQKDNWPAFALVSTGITFRSIMGYGLTTFIPLYFIGVLAQTEVAASGSLTLYAIIGAVATLLGGRLADRFGFNRIIRIAFTALVPLLLIFSVSNNVYFATFMLVPIAFAMSGAHSTMIVLGQGFLPNRVGLSSGIMLGLTVSIGGMLAPVIGWVGDNYGLPAAMYTITGVAVLALVIAYLIPNPDKLKKGAPAASVEAVQAVATSEASQGAEPRL
ncbi:MAG: MFS transporter [Ruminococcaceae bacterium]|nr:MFS transporter [Oscillospiraceae bacterium]